MKNILIIAPHEKIYATAKAITQNHQDVEIVHALLEEAIGFAEYAEKNGFEVIISRGGTSKMLEDSQVHLPVVDLTVSPYVLLRAVHEAKQYSDYITIIGFERVIKGVDQVGRILDANLEIVTIQNRHEAEAFAVRRMKYNRKIQVLMGGAVAESLARKYQIPTVLLETDAEAIYKSLAEARQLIEVRRKEQQKTELIEAVLHYINHGVLAVDGLGKITIFNDAASRLTGLARQAVLGKYISEVFDDQDIFKVMKTGEAKLGQVQKLGELMVLTNKAPVKIGNETAGAVATFEDITKIREYEQFIRSKLAERGHVAKLSFSDILGASCRIREVKFMARKCAEAGSNVLITGESGTGKELFAQSIHSAGGRRRGPFVAVNCSAIPDNLLESELFGYMEGAFTGAKKKGKEGLFAAAHHGTIFLDEISEISLSFQATLLRVVQEKEIRPVGSDRLIPIDVRIIAAANKDLWEEIHQGRFREDLFYRLNILPLNIPPLRERIEDVELLVRFFIKKHSKMLKKQVWIDETAVKALNAYGWPGNIRELENVCERLCVIYDSVITHKDILAVLNDLSRPADRPPSNINDLKYKLIVETINQCNGNKTEAAKKIGISRTTLWRLLKEKEAVLG